MGAKLIHSNRPKVPSVDNAVRDTAKALRKTLCEEAAGCVLEPRLISRLAVRLAGNIVRLRAGNPIMPWAGNELTWALVEVTGARRKRTPVQGLWGATLRFVILTGKAASREVEQFFIESGLDRMGQRVGVIGRHDYRSVHCRELVRMRMFLRMIKGAELEPAQYMERASLNKRNKFRVEARRKKRGCIQPTKYPCHFCPVGWGTCVNGTHMHDYVERDCKNGHRGMFDPTRRDSLCLQCACRMWLRAHD
jgi:hypothetical protein